MNPTDAIRRILKSWMRLTIFRALASEQPARNWVDVVEVEEAILESAWEAWIKIRPASAKHDLYIRAEISTLAQTALSQSVEDTRGFFDHLEPVWLNQILERFVENFRPAYFLEVACESAKS